MKKSFMNNLKNFVDTNVRHRIDRVSQNSGNINNSCDTLNDDLLLVEHHFDDIQVFCVDAEKKISNMLQSIQLSSTAPSNLGAYTQNVQAGLNNLSHNIAQQAANITSSASSISGFTNLATNDNNSKNLSNKESKSTLAQNQSSLCSQQYRSSDSLSKGIQSQNPANRVTNPDSNPTIELQLSDDILQRYKKLPIAQLIDLYLTYEQMIDSQCLKTIQHMLETDIPNVLKLKKTFLKAHNDLESLRSKYNGASQKQQQLQQQQQQATSTGHFTNTSYLISQNSIQQVNKLEQLKNELDEAVTKFEQARDVYEAELFGFVCREPELVNLMVTFHQLEAEYHQKVSFMIQSSSPAFCDTLARSPRKFAFGTPLEEHLRCTGRTISPVIELCTHFLHLRALKEEGLFRIPGSSIKIKKLKNGINAWFVTLMNLDGPESGQQRQTGNACIVALYDLFKNAIGQRQQSLQEHSETPDNLPRGSLSCDVSTLVRTSHSSSPNNEGHQSENNHDDYILDLHSIAGLLKLYLRELPEPLFTYAMYDDWIGCIANETDPGRRLECLINVMRQLPRANYENLKHLIKFLNRLTLFQEQNKMTSTNLAIAMAPSLIWSKPSNLEEAQASASTSNSDDAQSLNLQMCSFGVSASQHATIIEALINHADQLFPETTDYTLSEFSNLTLKSNRVSKTTNSRGAIARSVKSTSPTGLSTTSSSSFSSNASNSTASSAATAANKGHNRKGGSMEGLLSGPQDIKNVMPLNMSVRSIGRPVSVQIRHDDYSSLVGQNRSIAPAKPPVPTLRSHSRSTTIESPQPPPVQTTSHKQRAPPVPPPTSIRHQQERLKASGLSSSIEEGRLPRPVSLRGTGTISTAPSGQTSISATARPSVPPPERPSTTSALIIEDTTKTETTNRKCRSVDDTDAKSSQSLTSSGNIRGDFEEISANEVEDIDLSTQSNSPVVSLDDSISGDSSFDNENDKTSLDRSWAKCFKTTDSAGEREDELENRSGTLKVIVRDLALDHSAKQEPPQPSPSQPPEKSSVESISGLQDPSNSNTSEAGDQLAPPVKPPRSSSPKITQSTPL